MVLAQHMNHFLHDGDESAIAVYGALRPYRV